MQKRMCCTPAKLGISVIIPIVSEDRYFDVLELITALNEQNTGLSEVILVVGKSIALFNRFVNDVERLNLRQFKLIFNSGESSLSCQRNFAIPFGSGDIIAFLDDDVIPSQSWLNEIGHSFHDVNVVGVTGPVEPLFFGRKLYIPKEISWVISCTSWVNFKNKQVVPYAWGGNMAFRRQIFDQGLRFATGAGLGACNPFLICEDSDFSTKAMKASGGKIIWNSRAFVLHRMKTYRVSWRYLIRRAFSVGYTRTYVRYTSKDISQTSMDVMSVAGLVSRFPKAFTSKKIRSAKDLLMNSLSVIVVMLSLTFGFSYGVISTRKLRHDNKHSRVQLLQKSYVKASC